MPSSRMVTCDRIRSIMTLDSSATLSSDRVGGVLQVFPIENEGVVIHSGGDQTKQITTDGRGRRSSGAARGDRLQRDIGCGTSGSSRGS